MRRLPCACARCASKGADPFPVAQVVHGVDAVDEEHAGFGVVIGGFHEPLPQHSGAHVANHPAGHRGIVATPRPLDHFPFLGCFCRERWKAERMAPRRLPVESSVWHMASQMRMKETGPEAMAPVSCAGVPLGRRVEKS